MYLHIFSQNHQSLSGPGRTEKEDLRARRGQSRIKREYPSKKKEVKHRALAPEDEDNIDEET